MKKKVGILSMQRVINYGSYLQAYALKQMLLAAGAESVEFIDIREGTHLKGFEVSGLAYYMRRFKAFMRLVTERRVAAKARTMEFMDNVSAAIHNSWDLLGLKEFPSYPEVDLAIIGSDEVFHCCQTTWWGFTTQLYGNIPNARESASYAASFGSTTLDQLRRHGVADTIAENLNRLTHISVRDENSRSIVRELTGRDPRMDIDPVLAYGFAEEIRQAPDPDDSGYILLYSYPDRISDPREVKAIKDFARSRGKKLICAMSRYDWCYRAISPTPLELLGWFRNADMVITETFHGSIFSIITHRQFATFGRQGAMPKLLSMLSPYNLTDRLVADYDLESVFARTIDYEAVDRVLAEQRKLSMDYLRDALSDI